MLGGASLQYKTALILAHELFIFLRRQQIRMASWFF